jgi:hypothetical protein
MLWVYCIKKVTVDSFFIWCIYLSGRHFSPKCHTIVTGHTYFVSLSLNETVACMWYVQIVMFVSG